MQGDVVKTHRYRKETITLKTTTGCTKGDYLCYDTDGWAPATQALLAGPLAAMYKKYIATETIAAPGAGHAQASVLAEGVVGISKIAGALVKGQIVGATSTAGKVGARHGPDAPAAYNEANVQTELDHFNYGELEVLEDAADAATYVNVFID